MWILVCAADFASDGPIRRNFNESKNDVITEEEQNELATAFGFYASPRKDAVPCAPWEVSDGFKERAPEFQTVFRQVQARRKIVSIVAWHGIKADVQPVVTSKRLELMFWWYLTRVVPGLNLLLFACMGIDKGAAKLNAWRISESTLLGLAAGGGWVGGFVGSLLFRHKTHKRPFRLGFVIAVLSHGLFTVWLYLWCHSGQPEMTLEDIAEKYASVSTEAQARTQLTLFYLEGHNPAELLSPSDVGWWEDYISSRPFLAQFRDDLYAGRRDPGFFGVIAERWPIGEEFVQRYWLEKQLILYWESMDGRYDKRTNRRHFHWDAWFSSFRDELRVRLRAEKSPINREWLLDELEAYLKQRDNVEVTYSREP